MQVEDLQKRVSCRLTITTINLLHFHFYTFVFVKVILENIQLSNFLSTNFSEIFNNHIALNI